MAWRKADQTPIEFMTTKELRKALHSEGKRAQSRIKSLQKAFGEGGSMYGRKNPVLDRWGDFDTKVKGLSDEALRLKLETARRILEAKSSTVKGVKEIEKKRFDSFVENHPDLKIKTGGKRERRISRGQWVDAMKLLGKIQAAEKGGQYDSNEQMYMALQIALNSADNQGLTPENLFSDDGMAVSSADFFASAPLESVMNFIGDDDE